MLGFSSEKILLKWCIFKLKLLKIVVDWQLKLLFKFETNFVSDFERIPGKLCFPATVRCVASSCGILWFLLKWGLGGVRDVASAIISHEQTK